jgi:hypothetical protein
MRRIGSRWTLCAPAVLALASLGHPLDVNVTFFGQTGAMITVTHVPAKEPLGALKIRLRLKPQAGAQVIVATAPEPGPWSQVMPELRRSGENLTVWALAPNLGESLDGKTREVAHLDMILSPTATLAAAADLIDSVIVEEAFGPSGKKTTVAQNLVTSLVPASKPMAGAPVEKIDGPARTLSFTLAKAQRVRVFVSDFRGRRVADVFDRKLSQGMHEIRWDGKASAGGPLPAGTYSLRFEAGTYVYDRKVEVKP